MTHYVVTGASSGIGRALVARLARPGVSLVLVARRPDALASVADDARGAGAEASVQIVDLKDPDAAGAAAREAVARWGVPDVVVANAGLSIARSVLECVERPDTVTRTIGVNYTGAVAHLLPLVGAMATRGSGIVVGVTSAPCRLPLPGWGAYQASKAAFDMWLRCAAEDLRPHGVTVSNVAFGLVKTPMSLPMYGASPRWAQTPEQAAEWIVRAIERPGRRLVPGWVRPAEAFAGLAPGSAGRLAGLVAARVGLGGRGRE